MASGSVWVNINYKFHTVQNKKIMTILYTQVNALAPGTPCVKTPLVLECTRAQL